MEELVVAKIVDGKPHEVRIFYDENSGAWQLKCMSWSGSAMEQGKPLVVATPDLRVFAKLSGPGMDKLLGAASEVESLNAHIQRLMDRIEDLEGKVSALKSSVPSLLEIEQKIEQKIWTAIEGHTRKCKNWRE